MPRFLKIAILSVLSVVLIAFVIFIYWNLPSGTGVLQGYTDDTTTGFVIVSQIDQVKCEAESLETHQVIDAAKAENISYEDSDLFVHQCNFENLNSNQTYKLKVIEVKTAKVFEERIFNLIDFKKSQVNIAIESCTMDVFHLPMVWYQLFKSKPDYLFMIGDNVYADIFKDFVPTTHTLIWKRYARAWRVYALMKRRELIPTVAIWDDHDFGINNGDASFPLKNRSEIIFKAFYNQNENTPYLKHGPGTSLALSLFGTKFIFLDDRMFRSKGDDPSGNYFSADTLAWAFDAAKNSPNKAVWFISGSQFFGPPEGEEIFEHTHPSNFKNFIEKVIAIEKPVLLVSGDAHYSDVKKIPTGPQDFLYEITSSGMHIYPFVDIYPDARRLGATNQPNFVNVRFSKEDPTILQAQATTLFGTHPFSIQFQFQ